MQYENSKWEAKRTYAVELGTIEYTDLGRKEAKGWNVGIEDLYDSSVTALFEQQFLTCVISAATYLADCGDLEGTIYFGRTGDDTLDATGDSDWVVDLYGTVTYKANESNWDYEGI